MLEHGGTKGKQAAMALLDLTKAFELVPHLVLIYAARALQYPLWLLRLSLAAYRMTRRIGVSGVYSRACRATRGITAGSGFAVVELRILLFSCIEATYDTFEQLKREHWLWAYVDDITIVWLHESWQAACDKVKRVANSLAEQINGP